MGPDPGYGDHAHAARGSSGSTSPRSSTYTGRVITGSEAHALGLVTLVADDPLAAAQELAAEIAARSPDAVRGMKRLFDESWTGSTEETLRSRPTSSCGLIGSPNQLAAVTAGMTKQPAEFVDPT